MSNFNYRPIEHTLTITHEVAMFSGFQKICTDLWNTRTELEWPCVYISCDSNELYIPIFKADDAMVGYSVDEEGLGMYLPDELLFADAGIEICATWLALQLNAN